MFLVVRLPLVYNAILGQPILYDFEIATSIRWLCMKFPTEGGTTMGKGRQEESQVVYLAVVTGEEDEEVHREVMQIKDEEKKQRTQPAKN